MTTAPAESLVPPVADAPAGLTPIDMMPVPVSAGGGGRPFARQVADKALARPSAKLGLVWVGVLALLSVFAPFLANSHPYLIRLDGRWSSPLLASLTWVDWTLLGGTAVVVALAVAKRVRVGDKLWIGTLAVAALGAVAYGVRPATTNVVYDRFRTARADGRVGFVLNAPIPYSPSDRLPDQSHVSDRPPGWGLHGGHWMGTEDSGGDVASRLLHACRVAMSIGLYATGIAIAIGVAVGAAMGYFAGPVDLVGMRLIEMFEAIPNLFLMITLAAFFPGESYRFAMLMTVIGVTGWTGYARFLRAEVLRLRQADYVHAAVAAGLPTSSVVLRHVLPNAITPVVISASFSVAAAVVSESTLSFLGLGTIDQPSWGGMLTQSLGASGRFQWWLAVFPGVAIFLTVLSYNLLGEALADALDPKRT